ncbi:MAG TPA: c-type cytochrome biogenesis protein CcsB [Actinomycetes bacterium]
MSTARLAELSDTLVWLAVISYVTAAVLLGFELAYRVRWSGRAGVAVAVAGLAANAGAALARGLAAGRVPWGNMYEYSVMIAAVTVTGWLVWVARRREVRPLGTFVLLPAVLAIAAAALTLRVPAGPLVPALNSGWIKIHVVAAIIGSGTLCLASMFSALYLVAERAERRAAAPRPPLVAGGARTADRVEVSEAIASYATETEEPDADQGSSPTPGPAGRFLALLPSAEKLDDLAFKTTAFGFPIWTFAIMAGAIWAQSAWGRYWGWDPKETWSFIIWVVYAAYLHARATAGWRGRAAAWVSLVGMAAFIVNFYVVNTWVVGLHSYAK